MSIRDSLLPELQRVFSSMKMKTGFAPDPIAIFSPIHPDIGEVAIWDDGDEATIAIGEITHGHFNPYDQSLSEAEREKWVVEEVTDFLSLLFQDKVMLWSALDKGRGGWEVNRDEPLQLRENARNYVWSGPIK